MISLRPCLFSGAAVFAAAATLLAGSHGQNPPQFRAGTDLIRLDVSVLDRDRKPVRGLTAADFTLKEDGKLQKVDSFASIDVPDPVSPTALWMREVAPDVRTNQIDNRRLVVMVLDNWSGPLETWESRTGKKVAHDIVDRMGPADLMAVVVVGAPRYAQDFTDDRALLRAAIDQKEPVLDPHHIPVELNSTGSFLFVIGSVVNYLSDVHDRRKALIYVGTARFTPGAPLRPPGDLSTQALNANVNVYPFDINGLRAPEVDHANPGRGMIVDPGFSSRELLIGIANNTGGHATVNTNRPMDGVPPMFAENGSYYLLGYVSTNTRQEGKRRSIDVKVNRPKVTVRHREAYFEPPDPKRVRATPAPPVVQSAVAGVLPNRAVPMEVVLAPFAVPGRREAAVTVTVGLRAAAADTRSTDVVEVLTRAFTPVGEDRGQQTQGMRISRGSAGRAFNVLDQMPLLPGRYELRLSTRDIALDRVGSVYASVEIPDFAREPISLSGVVVADGVSLAGPLQALSAIIPVIPTTRREFARGDRATVFLRAYQGGQTLLAPITMAARLVSERDAVIVDRREVAPGDRFDAGARSLDYRFDLPLGQLEPGQYLLTIEAALDAKRSVRRFVRFSVTGPMK